MSACERRPGPTLVVSGPSGVGKTSVVNELVRIDPYFERAVTATTRPARPGETDGVDYLFLGEGNFDELERGGGLVESVRARSARYGLPRFELERIWDAGRVAVVIVDPDGKDAVTALCPAAVTIFLDGGPDLDASHETVLGRLVGRGEPSESVRSRMADNERVWRRRDEYDACVTDGPADPIEAVARCLIKEFRDVAARRGVATRGPGDPAEGNPSLRRAARDSRRAAAGVTVTDPDRTRSPRADGDPR